MSILSRVSCFPFPSPPPFQHMKWIMGRFSAKPFSPYSVRRIPLSLSRTKTVQSTFFSPDGGEKKKTAWREGDKGKIEKSMQADGVVKWGWVGGHETSEERGETEWARNGESERKEQRRRKGKKERERGDGNAERRNGKAALRSNLPQAFPRGAVFFWSCVEQNSQCAKGGSSFLSRWQLPIAYEVLRTTMYISPYGTYYRVHYADWRLQHGLRTKNPYEKGNGRLGFEAPGQGSMMHERTGVKARPKKREKNGV